MAMTITAQNWTALAYATSLSADLVSLMTLMQDNRASEENVRVSLQQIRSKAEFVAGFCAAAEKRI